MLSHDVPPGNPEAPWRYFLWRFLIDARCQSRGYGRAAMTLVVDHVRQAPGATELLTSVHPGEGSPSPFPCLRLRTDRREWFNGEEVYRLRLHPPQAT
jgi:diamine N-acetyltransferase